MRQLLLVCNVLVFEYEFFHAYFITNMFGMHIIYEILHLQSIIK